MTARRVNHPDCPSRKIRYRNKRAARAAIDTIRNARHRLGYPLADLWVYRCTSWHGMDGCGGWHLTSRPQWDTAPQPTQQEAAS